MSKVLVKELLKHKVSWPFRVPVNAAKLQLPVGAIGWPRAFDHVGV